MVGINGLGLAAIMCSSPRPACKGPEGSNRHTLVKIGIDAGLEVMRGAEILPTHAEVHGQARMDAPVVLDVHRNFIGPISTIIDRQLSGGGIDGSFRFSDGTLSNQRRYESALESIRRR